MPSRLSSLSIFGALIFGTLAVNIDVQASEPISLAQSVAHPITASVDQIAAAVTVRIDAPGIGNGSGVMVAKEGSTYTLLTAEHVVRNPEPYEIVTPDGQRHKPQTIRALPGLDLAVVQFSSGNTYQTAALGNYDITIEDRPLAFLSGFPMTDDDRPPTRELTVGTVFPTSVTLFAAQNAYSFASGRELVYTSKSQPGMSGGPIFDQLGRVIGIHNASETQLEAVNNGLVFPMNTGRSLGVPVRTFLGSGKFNATQLLAVQTGPPPRLSIGQVTQVLEQVQVPAPQKDVATDWLRYGNHLWRLRRYDQAVKATQQALRLNPDLYQAYYVQGLALSAQKQHQKAIVAFDAAINLNPRFYDSWRQKALSLQDDQQGSAALTAITRAIEIQSDDPGLYLIQGDIFKSLNQFSAAQQSYSQALTLKPSAFGYLQRGLATAAQEDYKAAKADFEKAIQLQPNDYFGYLARGLMELSYGNPESAIADFSQAKALVPQESAYLSLILMSQGLAHLGIGQYPEAIAAQGDAINRFVQGESPETVLTQSYLLRSLAYARSNNFPQAIADLNTLIQRQPKNASFFQTRGEYYFQSKDPQRAVLDFEQAIALDSENASAYQGRGLAYQALQQNQSAQQDFKQAIALLTDSIDQQPNGLSSAQLYVNRAQAHLGLQNLAGAKQDILNAERLFTNRGITTGVLYDTIQKMKGLLQKI